MKFQELNPIISETDITFDCPKCGPPHRIWIAARFNKHATDGTWFWTHNGESVTIVPSIYNQVHGRVPCGWHGSIIEGEVV